MTPEVLLILMFAALLGGILLGFPISFVFIGVSFIFGLLGVAFGCFTLWGLMDMMILRTFHTMSNYILAAVPLFIFMGVMIERSGCSERLFSSLHLALGGLRGGLAISVVLVCTIMAAASGIVGAAVVTMGLFALPALIRRGYDKALACGSIVAGGTLGILIPPSILLVIYGPMAAVSVGKLFAGAIFPGLILSGLYITYIAIRTYFKPELGPPLPVEERRAVPLRRKVVMLVGNLLPVLGLILAVLGLIFFGVAAPTEAAATGAAASIFLAAGYRQLNLKVLKEAVYRNLVISSMIVLTLVGAVIFSSVFMLLGGKKVVTSLLLNLPIGRWGILGVMMFAYFILGFFIEWVGLIPLLVPLFTPIAKQLGFDPLWFAMLCCIAMQTSFLTPPVAISLFYLKGVAPPEVKFGEHIIGGAWPFIGLQLIGLVLFILFPDIILWLPSKMVIR